MADAHPGWVFLLRLFLFVAIHIQIRAFLGLQRLLELILKWSVLRRFASLPHLEDETYKLAFPSLYNHVAPLCFIVQLYFSLIMPFLLSLSQLVPKESLFQGHWPLVMGQPIAVHKETTFVKAPSYKTPTGWALQCSEGGTNADPVILAPGKVARRWMHMDRASLHPQKQRMLPLKDPVLFSGSNASVWTNGSVWSAEAPGHQETPKIHYEMIAKG